MKKHSTVMAAEALAEEKANELAVAREFPVPSVDAVVQLESLQLLNEVADHLGRLPVNPMTYRLKRKIEDYLQRPGANAHRARTEQTAKDQQWLNRLQAGECFTGSERYTPVGLPAVDCLVVGGQVHLRSPALSHAISHGTDADQMAISFGRELAEGIDIELTKITSITSRFVAQNWPNHRHQFK